MVREHSPFPPVEAPVRWGRLSIAESIFHKEAEVENRHEGEGDVIARTADPKQVAETRKTSGLPLLVRITRADKQQVAATLRNR